MSIFWNIQPDFFSFRWQIFRSPEWIWILILNKIWQKWSTINVLKQYSIGGKWEQPKIERNQVRLLALSRKPLLRSRHVFIYESSVQFCKSLTVRPPRSMVTWVRVIACLNGNDWIVPRVHPHPHSHFCSLKFPTSYSSYYVNYLNKVGELVNYVGEIVRGF